MNPRDAELLRSQDRPADIVRPATRDRGRLALGRIRRAMPGWPRSSTVRHGARSSRTYSGTVRTILLAERGRRSRRRAAPRARQELAVRLLARLASVLRVRRHGRDGACRPASASRARVRLAAELGVGHLELRHRFATEPHWPRQDLYVTFRKEIAPDPEANMLAIPRKQRAMVRKGIKAGLRSEIDDSIERFFTLYADNMHRHGTPPFSKRYFETLKRDVRSGLRGPHRRATLPGSPFPASCRSTSATKCLPYYAGDLSEARDLGRQRLQVLGAHASRLRARVSRVRLRPKQARHRLVRLQEELGVRADAARLRVRALRGGTRFRENNPLNPKYRALIALWRRLPLPVANAIGPWIVRGLG